MNEYRLWPDGDWEDTSEDNEGGWNKSDDYILVTEKTTMGEIISQVGWEQAGVFLREIFGE